MENHVRRGMTVYILIFFVHVDESTSKNLDHTWKFTKGHHKIFLDFVVESNISVSSQKNYGKF